MSNLSYWINKVGFSLTNRFIVFFFGFANYFLMVRYLDKSDFGIYSLYLVIIMISELAISAFVQNGFIKFYLDDRLNKNMVFFTSLILNILLTSCSVVIIYFLSGYISDFFGFTELEIMLKMYCISAFLLIPFTQVNYYLNAEVDFKSISLLSLLRYGSFFVGVITTFFFVPDINQVGFVKLQVASIALGSVASLFILRKIRLTFENFSKDIFQRIFHFGKYVFGVGLTSILTKSVDQLMIGYFISAEAVATYGIAGKFMNFIEVPISSISHVIYPKFAETINTENPEVERAKIYERSVGTMLAIITPFILIIFTLPSFFISIAAGDKYLNGVPILQILIIYNLIKPFATQAGAVLEVSGKPKIGFYALLFATFANIILNYFLIQSEGPFGGIMGAVVASVLSGFFFLAIILRAIHKECNTSIVKTLKNFLEAYVIGFNLLKTAIKKIR